MLVERRLTGSELEARLLRLVDETRTVSSVARAALIAGLPLVEQRERERWTDNRQLEADGESRDRAA